MSVGFDFGTTNSLVSVVVGGLALDVLDDEGRPHPSVVRYEGEDVVVGHEARRALDEAGLGVHGNTIRSPKMYLGDEIVTVGGVDRSPVDIVADVVRHVKAESLRSALGSNLNNLERSVVTIPVSMNGPRRAALREAFARADISVAQFVHEPLAALYGYIRGSSDPDAEVRRLARRNVLVVDWGGGTLDLTLCRVEPNRILQVRNGGSDEVGGDLFDTVIRDEVVKRFSLRAGIEGSDRPTPEARSRLLQATEKNKIDLSQRQKVSFYRSAYFSQSGTTLEYALTRQELDEITRPLVTLGISAIESLLESIDMAPAQVSMCLVVGGMAAMPTIRGRLHEMFGPEKVVVPENSATLISQGAAWIAHDVQHLVLAKPIELEMARGSRLTLVRSGSEMPVDSTVKTDVVSLYCTDPSDGLAKFMIVSPQRLKENDQVSDPRTALGSIALEVDRTARPLHERLTLAVEIDQDLILKLRASSSQRGDSQEARYYDLEFGIGLSDLSQTKSHVLVDRPRAAVMAARQTGAGLVVRANIADERDENLVPGEVLYTHNSYAFERSVVGGATQQQVEERLYYQPCAVCKRKWGDPSCRCASGH